MRTRTFLGLQLLLLLGLSGVPSPFSGVARAAQAKQLVLPAGVKLVGKGSAIAGTPEAYKFLLPNGLRVIILPDDRNPVAMLRIMLDAGSNREVRGETGLAHFFEHMMFRKTEVTDEGHYDRTLAGVGGNGNAGTSTDYVVYYSTFPGPALDRMLEIESQRFTKLSLVDPYFTTEKGAVISERFMRLENNPSERGREIIRSIVERGTPYEWVVIGTKDDVKNMSIDAAKKFYKNFYTPDNAVLTLGGPFDVNTALQKVVFTFSDWKGEVAKKHPPLPKDYFTRHAGKSYVCSEAVTEQRFQITYPSANTSFKDDIISIVFSQMLDDHPEGVFKRRLLKDKLASNFYVYKQSHQFQTQPLVVGLFLNKEQKFADAEAFWKKGIEEALRHPLDERFKRRVMKQLEVMEAQTAERMTALAENYEWNEYLYGDFVAQRKAQDIVKKLSQSEFRAWIQTNFVKNKSFTVGIVPNGMAEPCSKLAAASDAVKNPGGANEAK